MRMTTKEKAAYANIMNKSFEARLNIFLFEKVKHNQQLPTDHKPFLDYNLDDKNTEAVLDEYITRYWQLGFKDKITETMTVDDVWSKMESLKKQNIIQKYDQAYATHYVKVIFPEDKFLELYRKEDCEYCNISIKTIDKLIDQRKLFKKHDTRGNTMEIDRKSPNKEYTTENTVRCCYWCNNAKTDEFTEPEFRPIAKQIRKVWEDRLKELLTPPTTL